MPRPSKRDQLVEATKELLWEVGYEAMSPRDIQARSAAKPGSLYHHFPSELAIAEVALGEVAAEEIARLEAFSRQTPRRWRVFSPAFPTPSVGRDIHQLLGRMHRSRKDRYSITSSAVASSDGGTVIPSALAVLRLMTRSNLVGCSTGMSAGVAPRNILSMYSADRRHSSGKFGP
jgi:AcrR family transcriptional regulator